MKKYYWFFIVVFLASCVKDPQNIPPQITEDPVFGMNALIGGVNIQLDAGVDNYVMQTQWDVDTNGIAYSEASFEETDCNSACGPKIEFRFYSDTDEPGSEHQLTSALSVGEKQIAGPSISPDSVQVSFSIMPPENPAPAFFWDTPEGNHLSNNETIVSRQETDEIVNVCLNTLTNENCFSTKCIEFIPDQSLGGCDISIATALLEGGYILLEAKPSGVPPFTYHWKIGAGEATSDQSKIIVPAPVSDGKMMIELITIDATDCKTQLLQMIEISSLGVKVCPLDLTFEMIRVPGQFVLPFNQSEITYTDANGEIYNSRLSEQPVFSFLEIFSAEDFNPSPTGDATKIMELDIDCFLFTKDATDSLRIQTNSSVIGAAFPGG